MWEVRRQFTEGLAKLRLNRRKEENGRESGGGKEAGGRPDRSRTPTLTPARFLLPVDSPFASTRPLLFPPASSPFWSSPQRGSSLAFQFTNSLTLRGMQISLGLLRPILLLSTLFVSQARAANFTFTFSNPTQCDNFAVSWSGEYFPFPQ